MPALFCWENLVTAANISTTFGMDAKLPITNLADRRLAKVARRSTSTGQMQFDVDTGSTLTRVQVVALLNCNFRLITNGTGGLSAGATSWLRASNVAMGNTEILNETSWSLIDRFFDGQQFHCIQYLFSDTGLAARYWRTTFTWTQPTGTPGQAGRAWISRALSVPDMDLGVHMTVVDPSVVRRSRGQQVYVDEKLRYRVLDFSISQLTTAQVYDDATMGARSFQELFTTAGIGREVLIIPSTPASVSDFRGQQYMTRRTIYGTLAGPLKIEQQSQGLYRVAGSIIEAR